MELQQSPIYKTYIEHLGWTVVVLDAVQIFIKRIPLYGVLAKIQRPEQLPYIPKLVPLLKSYHVQKVVIEPTHQTDPDDLTAYIRTLSSFFTVQHTIFLPTKTIRIDLTRSEDAIFKSFTQAKRRAVRKAQKNHIVITKSNSIQTLCSVKNKSAGMFGSITTSGIDILWNTFPNANKCILLAYKTIPQRQLVGGILLLFWDTLAYYWIAGATKEGKKLFAPTLLVWEAIKISKLQKMITFDFVGVFDERTPKQFKSWKGFTKFKEGFGGEALYYPIGKS